jgi:ankyrin repeat protein
LLDKLELDVLKELLSYGIDVNVRNCVQSTPLFFCNTIEEIDLLFTAGAKINECDILDNTALH